MILKPRPYQSRDTLALEAAFEEGHRGVTYVLPTGGGKTVVFVTLAELAAAVGVETVILVHRDNLLQQATAKLRDCGVPYSIIAPGHRFYGDKVAVASVQTLARRLERHHFRFIITDEGHHGVSPTYKKVYDRYQEAQLLHVTATPQRLDGRGLSEICTKLVLGPSVRELIDDGYLAEPVYVGAKKMVDLSRVHTQMGDFNMRELADVMDQENLIGNAVEHYREMAPGQPAIAFCVNRKHAEDTAAQFCRAGYRFANVDGTMHLRDIRRRIAGLGDGSLDGITSCELVSEGTDVPRAAVGIMLRPTKSVAVSMQQTGRLLRPVYAPGFDLGTRAGRLAAIAAGPKPNALVIDHAGNWCRPGIGFADDEREWTLEGRKRRVGKGEGVAGIAARQCPACFKCHRPAPSCPFCGHTYVVTAESPETEEGQMVVVDKEAMRRQKSALVRSARTYADLKAVGKQLGYSPVWAMRRAQELGIV